MNLKKERGSRTAAAPPAERVALEEASQYAGSSTPWTPENAESVGLDPERGFIARGVPISAPAPPPTPVEPRPPGMAPGLGTVSGAPTQPPPQAKRAPSTKPVWTPADAGDKPAQDQSNAPAKVWTPADAGDKPAQQAPGKVWTPADEGDKPANVQAAIPQPEKPPESQPQPSADDRDAKIQAQIKTEGKTPGEAQAIVDGQQPTTITGETPPPKPAPAPKTEQPQQLPQPIDSLKADDKNRVDPVSLYNYLLGKFAKSSVLNHPPADGDFWKIKTGSAAEWAAFALAVAKQESDLNARSTNLRDPGGSYGLFQFSQKGQPQYTNGEDQYDPQHSADAFVRAVEQLVGQKGKIANLGVTFGSIKRPNEAGQYISGAQKVAAGGSGKDLVSSGGGGGEGAGDGGGGGPPPPGGQPAGQPMVSIPSAGGHPQLSGQGPGGGGWSGDSGYGGGRETTPRTADAGSIDLTSLLGAAAGGAAAGSLFGGGGGGGGGRPQAAQPSEEKGPSPSDVVAKVLAAGGPPPAPSGPVDLSTMKPANVLSVKTPGAPQLGLPGPPAAPSAAPTAPDPSVIKGLMKAGFTFEQANAFAAKAKVSKPGAATIAGAASFRKPAQLPAPPAAPSRQPPPPAVKPQPQPQAPAAAKPQAQVPFRSGTSTIGVAQPAGSEALAGLALTQALKQHATLLSPDDPRVKKQADNMTKGEHFVPGDPVHEDLLNGLPGGHGGRQRQILGHAEEAIAEKRPMHISYISAPQEAQKFPTRESRTIQYESHSPEARLMGTTEGQLVGHSFIPTAVGISPSRKAGEPHQSYIQGVSTNVLANNFAHVNTKLAAMGQKTPYAKLGPKFANDLEGYLHNLNAGHTGTGRGYAVGTPEYPSTPDESHVPYRLTRREADFLNTVINNTGAFAKHEDGQALRELARANGTLITPEGETNRMRHEMEQHEPGWRNRMLEPSIRSFKTGLIHEVHPSEEHLPATIRPGQEYRDLTAAMARTSDRGRPDVPVSVSLHHTFADNKAINQIERDFSEERINEHEARQRLHALGEDPDQYRFIGGSGGLITPYEENPEAITPEEHTQLKDNLRKQWIGGKLNVEDYRKKAAEVPLPEIPSRPAEESPAPTKQKAAEAPDHFAKINQLHQELGTEGLQKLLKTKKTVRELSDEYGLKILGEKSDTPIYGAMAFGPKIGALLSKLTLAKQPSSKNPEKPGGILKMQGGGFVPPNPANSNPFQYNSWGTATTFGGQSDLDKFNKCKAEHPNWTDKQCFGAPYYGDNGIGAFGGAKTTYTYGAAVPQSQLEKQFGPLNNADGSINEATHAKIRAARAQVTYNGQTVALPILDIGPSEDLFKKNKVADLTEQTQKAWGVNDPHVNIKVVPNAGPDYLKDRPGFDVDQQNIHDQLTAKTGLPGIGAEPNPTPLSTQMGVPRAEFVAPPSSSGSPTPSWAQLGGARPAEPVNP